MTELSKAEGELVEKIARELCRQVSEDSWETLPLKRPTGRASYLGIYKRQFYDLSKPILTLVKEALPELAKEAGYRLYSGQSIALLPPKKMDIDGY